MFIRYIYICLPWVSRLQFHAFSLVKRHDKPGYTSVCFQCVGDWTKKVHRLTVKPTHRPAWIYGTPLTLHHNPMLSVTSTNASRFQQTYKTLYPQRELFQNLSFGWQVHFHHRVLPRPTTRIFWLSHRELVCDTQSS